MNKSALQLEHYSLRKVSLAAREGIEPLELGAYADFGDAVFRSAVSFGTLTLPDGQTRLTVDLQLTGEPKPDRPFPYTFEIALVGVFQGDALPAERRNDLVLVNGASLLYTAARDILLTLSMRSTMGFMLLPSVNFASLASDSKAEAPGASPAPAVPAAPAAVGTP